ncbi:DUF6287 domain-containing protein [Bifidobacterium sp. ESL0690]|uniref:DUF6287 domain-containing protein n=1 Tax=Bifidobacterium sp. ESL0690 TaxID=2983214 RepID=UPI0023F73152|nr:DUF6287 domain-containing protein [Bifidobacterium sp. ESL0690]WEV47356.1 DUF6287 domain-containing protein [Bifidobacterium sp. ESL0690]
MSGNQSWTQPSTNPPYPAPANNTTYNAPTSSVPPLPTNVPLPSGMPQPNGGAAPANPHKSKTTRIVIIIAVLVMVVAAIAAGGFYYFSSNSHDAAVSQYGKAVNHFADTKSALKSAIKHANRDTEDIHKGQVKNPGLLDDYRQTLKTSRNLSEAKAPATIADTSSASTKDLKQATRSLNDLSRRVSDSANDISDAAKKLVNSKNDADAVLEPIEREVSTAEKQKKANDEEAADSGIDLSEIKRGDYSSLDGTWTNPGGAWMKISNGKVTPQNPVEGSNPPYRLADCPGGEDDYCFSPGTLPSSQYQLLQNGALQDFHGEEVNLQYSLIVVPRNVTLYNASYDSDDVGSDPTDSSRDRIIPSAGPAINQGQTPLCGDSGCAYYRSDGGEVSQTSKRKLKSKVDAANDDIASMDEKWEEEAKANFQCRVDVVNGAKKTCRSISNADDSDEADQSDDTDTGNSDTSAYLEPNTSDKRLSLLASIRRSGGENPDSNHQLGDVARRELRFVD